MSVDPGAGYRLLEKGEVILAGDEVRCSVVGGWLSTGCIGGVVGGSPITDCTYRRKAETAPTPAILLAEIGALQAEHTVLSESRKLTNDALHAVGQKIVVAKERLRTEFPERRFYYKGVVWSTFQGEWTCQEVEDLG